METKKDGNKLPEEIVSGLGAGKEWNTKVHDVDLIVHSSLGTIKMMTQKMSDSQIASLRSELKSKFGNTHGCFEMTMEDGVIMIPHEVLVNSIIQFGIDVKHEEPKKARKPRKPKAAPVSVVNNAVNDPGVKLGG